MCAPGEAGTRAVATGSQAAQTALTAGHIPAEGTAAAGRADLVSRHITAVYRRRTRPSPGTTLAFSAVEFQEIPVMPSSRLAFSALAAACIAAAAGGGYLAVR